MSPRAAIDYAPERVELSSERDFSLAKEGLGMFKIPTALGINSKSQLGGMIASHMSLGWGFLKVSPDPKKLIGECLPICIS